MSDVWVWRAGADEAEAVAGLLVEFRDHLGRDWPSPNSLLAAVARLLDDPQTEYLLAAPHDDAPPSGVAQLRFRDGVWLAAPDCWLEDLFVRGAARRAGLGAALLQATLDRARARGCRRVELNTGERNAAARALYERFGFRCEAGDGGRDLLLRRTLED